MNFGYAQPFSFKIERSQAKDTQKSNSIVASIRSGVTEIILNDGRVVRATLQVTSVAINPKKPGSVDVSCSVATEIVTVPDSIMLDAHETLQ